MLRPPTRLCPRMKPVGSSPGSRLIMGFMTPWAACSIPAPGRGKSIGYACRDPADPAGQRLYHRDGYSLSTRRFLWRRCRWAVEPDHRQRYAVRVDPATSSLHLIRFDDGFHGDGQVMGPGARISATGSGWHHLKVASTGPGSRFSMTMPPVPNINIHDASFKSGYAGLDFWSDTDPLGPIYNNFTISEIRGAGLFGDDFGEGSCQS